MTTKSEIRKWVKPLTEGRPELVLHGRVLVFRPLQHLIRGLSFRSGRGRSWPSISWFFYPTFSAPGSWNSRFERDIPVGSSEGPHFNQHLVERAAEAITDYLVLNKSIRNFHDFALRYEGFMFGNLGHFPREHATTLAALGRFDEAAALLSPAVDELQAIGKARIELRQAVLERRHKLRRGEIILSGGEDYLRMADTYRPLLAALKTRDATAVAALLAEWEATNIARWDVGSYWQPTPFPFEEVAHAR